jgi:Protein of unknown function (DUF1579)
MAEETAAALARLDVLLGRWKTAGRTIDGAGAPAQVIDALDTYERLPGGALLHLVDAHVGDEQVEGAEIIGYDPGRGCYVTQYFGSDGPNAYEASLDDAYGTLVWTMRSNRDRFTGAFDNGRRTITGHWEALDDESNWKRWMDITLTKAS